MHARAFAALTFTIACACSASKSDALVVDETGSSDDADTGDAATDAPLETPPDPPLTCPVPLPVDSHGDARAACTFTSGARVAETLGIPPGGKLPIRHVIVVMKENRAFDHLLGKLHDVQPDVEPVPDTFANTDATGGAVKPYHATTTCLHHDPNHQWAAMHAAVDGGKMDGFVANAAKSTGIDGHFVMSYYDATDLPFYYWLASNWSIGDHHFASARSGTYPNRLFLYLGTNDGVKETSIFFPDPATPTLFDALDAAGLTWGVFSDGTPLSGALNWDHGHRGVAHFADFMRALDGGSLPNVSFVDAREDVEDEHPTGDVQVGEAWTRNVYEHAIASPQWPRLALVWTYDEGGGFADHVAPPEKWCVARPGNPKDAPYVELGVRVPFAVISPYAKPHHVSHVIREHAAITRFIEALFDLPSLTARDGNEDALMDLFDFASCPPPMLHPPVAPAAGTKGCGPG